ncbi:MAG TPA: type II toxin-antitoxin system Phd/YefM family antitoxin [Ilumatobacter sp.]|nr:type II toxin-antitoxin system Phd/YefM family antitoxin [Ilumatobacter sp.]
MATQIQASEFKATCLALLDQVATTGEEIVITKRGRPLARLVPIDDGASLLGSVIFHVSEVELFGVEEPWEADVAGDPA